MEQGVDVRDRKTCGKLSVVSTFYNEETVLSELVNRLRKILAKEQGRWSIDSYELIFVNDDSSDDSLRVLLDLMKDHDDMIVVNMSRNFGVYECIMAGLAHATGDLVVYLDADLQDPPELIPKLIDAWRSDTEVEVVYTTRSRRVGENPLKMLITKWGYRLLNKITDIKLPVDSGDFKLLSRRAVDQVLRFKEKKPFFRGLATWIGFKQAQVFYDREARFDGKKNTKRRALSAKIINFWLDTALISFSDVPLRLSIFVGFFVMIISVLYIVVVIFQKIMGWYAPGWPSLMAVILFLGSIQLIMIGILSLYVITIYQEVKQRPNYVVKNVLRNSKDVELLSGRRHEG